MMATHAQRASARANVVRPPKLRQSDHSSSITRWAVDDCDGRIKVDQIARQGAHAEPTRGNTPKPYREGRDFGFNEIAATRPPPASLSQQPKLHACRVHVGFTQFTPFWTHLFALGIMVVLGGRGQLAQFFIGSSAGGMSDFFSHPLMLAALWFAVILGLLALAVVGLRRWRGDAADDQPTTSELLTKFREVHARGGLSDDEYRTIKTKLATELDAELNSNNETS